MRDTLEPTLDIVFKLLFGPPDSRDILTALVTAVLRPTSPIVVVDVRNPEVSREAVDGKSIVLDLHLVLADGRAIDVEMQANGRPAHHARILYYWARLYGSQLERGEPYTRLRPVVSVVFRDYAAPDSDFHEVYRVYDVRRGRLYSDGLELHQVDLPRAVEANAAARQDESELLAWSRFLSAKDAEAAKEAAMDDPMIEKARARLEALSADPEARALALMRQLALDRSRIELGAARHEGLEEGREQGREEGREEVRQALRRSILILAEAVGISPTDEQRLAFDSLEVGALQALLERIARERRW